MAITYSIFGQDISPVMKGQATFVTTQNVYVKFPNTEVIMVGDTLRLATTNIPCLLVKSKSTTSVVSALISDCQVQKGDEVLFYPHLEEMAFTEAIPLPVVAPTEEPMETSLYHEKIRGRISLSDFSTLSSVRDNRHRIMGRLSMNADHIRDSKFSFNTYMNYQYFLDEVSSTSIPSNSILRVFNLGVQYDATPTLSVTLGRNINPKISSLGPIDGLQAEKYFGKQYIGIIAGFRPDIFNFGFNANLLEYGGYVGTMTDLDNFNSQTTLGMIQQQNNGAVDRRYGYMQHNSTLYKNLNLFSSLEVDLFSKVNDTVTNQIRLTNLYVSASYRFSRKVSLMVSYDSRKRILYYETFQTEIERLLDDDIARQGARARINVRPLKNILAGGSYSMRFQSDQQNKSDNIYGYVTWSRLPTIGGRMSLSYNNNASNYLTSNIFSLRHSRDLFRNRVNADFYYRYVNYQYANFNDPSIQHYVGTDISYYITRKLFFSVSGELSTLENENTYRIFTQISQRF
jgi:hypothetical protein